MNYRKALWQVGAASLLLGAVLLWLLSHAPLPTPTAPTASATTTINNLSVADISAVAVKNGADTYGLMVDPDGAVTLVAKGDAPGADYAVDEMRGFIFLLAKLTASQALDPQQNLADFGLSEPRASLAMILKDGRTLRFRLGKASPVGDGYYFQKDGEARVFVIGKLTGDLMLRARSDYWNRQLLPQLSAQTVNRLSSVQLASRLQPLANWRLEHRGEASFQLTQPVNGLVHAENAFKLLLLPLSGLQADTLVSATGPLSAYGLDQPAQELTLQWDGQAHRILIAPAPQGGYFLNRKGDPAVFSLSSEKAQFLRLAYRDLMGDRVYNGSLAAVARIDVSRPAAQIAHTMSIHGEGTELFGVIKGRSVPYADLGRVLAPVYDIGIVAEVAHDASARDGLAQALAPGPQTTVSITKRDGNTDRIEFFSRNASLSYLRLNGRVDFLVYTRAADALVDALAGSARTTPATPATPGS